jgi:hypothetical protein
MINSIKQPSLPARRDWVKKQDANKAKLGSTLE